MIPNAGEVVKSSDDGGAILSKNKLSSKILLQCRVSACNFYQSAALPKALQITDFGDTEMKKICRSASVMAFVLAATSSAYAADVAVPASYDWSGFYAGVNAGVGIDASSYDYKYLVTPAGGGETLVDKRLSNDFSGDQAAFTGGGLIGYNYQIDHFVLGVEADINYIGLNDDYSRTVNSVIGPISATSNTDISYETNWFGTIRGRVGYALDNVLVYGTGGFAYGNTSVDETATGCGQIGDNPPRCSALSGGTDGVNWGWTVGAGAEYGFDRWSLGIEYLYVDLGSVDWKTDPNVADLFTVNPVGDADIGFSVVRATAKLRF